MSEPGPFGWVSNLLRWSNRDSHVGGQDGPLPPSRMRTKDSTSNDVYQGLADGWLHGTVGAALSSFFSEPRTRKDLYVLFEKMDMTDVVGGFLDLVSEDATEVDTEMKRRVWATGPEAVVSATMAMFDRLKTEEECPAETRDLAKFGDDFNRLVYSSGILGGVRRMLPNPPINITRKENKEGALDGYSQTGKRFRNDHSEISYPWDFAHFRIRGRDRRYPYGTSLLHNGIRPWKQLIVFEDWMMGYTINKHPDRNLVMLDVGTSSDSEAAEVTRRFKQKLVKHVLLDPAGTSGQFMQQRYNAHSPLEDIVLPIRPDSATNVQKLSGSANATDIVPLMLTIQKLYAALRAPKEFFGFGDNAVLMQNMNPKATLTNQDVRYSRVVRKLQNAKKAGYRYLAELNLILIMSPGDRSINEITPADLRALDWRLDGNDFDIHMAPISFLDELERLEVMQTRQQVALGLAEMSANNPAIDIIQWTDYIFRDVLRIPDEKLNSIIRQDLEMQHIDNMSMGLMPNGEPVPTDKKVAEGYKERMKAVSDALRRMPSAERRALAEKPMDAKAKVMLSEAVRSNPRLREVIGLGKAIFHESERIPHNGVLPKDVAEKVGLSDCLTDADVADMMDEARRGVVDNVESHDDE